MRVIAPAEIAPSSTSRAARADASAAAAPARMLHVSLIIEFLRSHPALLFWAAALGQALIWLLVPTLFYPSPPGGLPELLAAGRDWMLGAQATPPFAAIAAEFAYRVAGGRVFGVYLLAQLCFVVTYWAVFTLGRRIVGVQHAVLATLLMVGVHVLSVPTPNFNADILSMPLFALAVLFYWRAVGERNPVGWLALGIDLGLLVWTNWIGVLLVLVIVLFTVLTQRGRAALLSFEPWIGIALAVVILWPHPQWRALSASGLLQLSPELLGRFAQPDAWRTALRFPQSFAAGHYGLVLLGIIAGGVMIGRYEPAPVFERARASRFAKTFVYTFLFAPLLLLLLSAIVQHRAIAPASLAPFAVLSGLAAIVAAGSRIALHRERTLARVWLGLLVGPALVAIAAVLLSPYVFGIELAVNQPAAEMGRFFSDSFRRRTGKPLTLIIGEEWFASRIALGAPDRPRVLAADPGAAATSDDAAIKSAGAVVVWRIADVTGAPPAEIRARFPDLAADVPRSFERPLEGRLPPLRVGWAVIRPQEAPAPNTPAAAQ